MTQKFASILEYPSELARLLMQTGRFEKAEKVLRNVEKIWPNAPVEKCLLGLDLKLKNLRKKDGEINEITYFATVWSIRVPSLQWSSCLLWLLKS